MQKSILVIAPGHDERDRRVNRSLEVFNEVYDSVTVVYESRFSLGCDKFKKIKGVQYDYISNTQPIFRAIPRLAVYYKWVQSIKSEYSVIYIHDSGILGLFIGKKIKKSKSKSKIIFDYHDFIQWEVFFQVGKLVKFSVMHRVIWRLMLFILRLNFINRYIFDGVVGISESQKNSLVSFLKPRQPIYTLVIPNSRKKISLTDRCSDSSAGKISYLWVGNIVNGRDIESILFFLDRIKEEEAIEFSFKIIGNVISNKLFSELKKRDYFEYAGGFTSDQDILNKLGSDLNIGIFMGWQDDFNVGINEVASPNKLYSYLNIGIPIICYSRLQDFSKILSKKSAFFVDDYQGFLNASFELKENYESFRSLVLLERDNVEWEQNLSQKLRCFLVSKFLD